jgi:hypothetical protein
MPLSLICACGARIELDDTLAGQEVACPECQQPLKAPPAAQTQPLRTSGFALASLVLAITGAFTIVGTVVAIGLGLIAVVMILRQRDRLAGLGYAFAGIAIGIVFTPLTLFAFMSGELFGISAAMREQNMAPFVDRTGPLEVVNRGWGITRPSEQWGVARGTKVNDPLADLFLAKSTPDIVLVQIKHSGFVDVLQETDSGKKLDDFFNEYLGEYKSKQEDQFAVDPKGKEEGWMRITDGKDTGGGIHVMNTLPSGCDGGREAEMEVQAAGQKWMMVVRIYHNSQTKSFYILRGYTPRRFFGDNKSDFTKAMDSFRILK